MLFNFTTIAGSARFLLLSRIVAWKVIAPIYVILPFNMLTVIASKNGLLTLQNIICKSEQRSLNRNPVTLDLPNYVNPKNLKPKRQFFALLCFKVIYFKVKKFLG